MWGLCVHGLNVLRMVGRVCGVWCVCVWGVHVVHLCGACVWCMCGLGVVCVACSVHPVVYMWFVCHVCGTWV